jgi:3-methyladenine DNA glycosylase AlkD
MKVDDYLHELKEAFSRHEDSGKAIAMKAYMKGHFDFLGIQSTERKALSRPFLHSDHRPTYPELQEVVRRLWELPHREFQYFGMELATKYSREWDEHAPDLFHFMITHKSWWDTVDFISTNLMGAYFRKRPTEAEEYMTALNRSGNLWLERCSILYQLKYKNRTNTELLERFIVEHIESKEFSHRKAIGWALRQYSKTDPEWVRSVLNRYKFSPLSVREGSKYI